MDDKELTFTCNADVPPAIPDGDHYQVVFVRAERQVQFGQEKIFLRFKIITDGEWHGQELFMACTIPPKRRFGPSSKYWQVYVLAAGTRPKRNDRMSTAVFRNKVFRARLRTVIKTAKQTIRTRAQQYSVIDDLLEVMVGC